MARPRSAGYAEQRSSLLAAAAGVFARRGYTAATLNEVALASGVSKATVYHYFADKKQLLFEIANDHVRHLQDVVSELEQRHLHPSDHLRGLIEHFLQAYAGAENAHRVLTEDVKFLDAAERATVEDGQRRVVSAFAQAIAAVRPDLSSGLHKPLAMLLFGMINWTFTWLRPGGGLTHQQLAPVVVELFLGGLQQLASTALPQQPLQG
jgi:AcrR family transcriptional regulator